MVNEQLCLIDDRGRALQESCFGQKKSQLVTILADIIESRHPCHSATLRLLYKAKDQASADAMLDVFRKGNLITPL